MRILIDISDDAYTRLFDNGDEVGEDRDIQYNHDMCQICKAIRKGTIINVTGDVISKADTVEKIKYGIDDKACFGSPLIDWAVIKFIQGLPSITDDKNDSE